MFEITVLVLFAKLMWPGENKRRVSVFPGVPLFLVELGNLIVSLVKLLNITLQSNTENAWFCKDYFCIILFLGAQIT